jgi:putative ABC transport system ATP-binding protein
MTTEENHPMLEMKNIRKIYRTESIETHALEDLSLSVAAGEFISVTGPSGSGKTTFLNVAGLLDTFEGGSYILDGKDVSRLSDREMSQIRNRTIGFVFQSFNLIPDLNVFDNVDVPLRYRGLGAADRKQRIERALEMVGLSARVRHLPSQLSGGQQQRVAIARVLAGDPKLILADEPTGNLDSAMTREILDLLDRVNAAGTTIVMVTHSPECAERAHRQLHVFDGRIADLRRPAVTMARTGSAGLAATLS